jgi:hypothetical protein
MIGKLSEIARKKTGFSACIYLYLCMHGAKELVRRLCCRQGSQDGIIVKRRDESWHGCI